MKLCKQCYEDWRGFPLSKLWSWLFRAKFEIVRPQECSCNCHKRIKKKWVKRAMLKRMGVNANGMETSNQKPLEGRRAFVLRLWRDAHKSLLLLGNKIRAWLSDMREVFKAFLAPIFVVSTWVYVCIALNIPNPFRMCMIWGFIAVLSLLVAYYNPKARC